MNTQAAERRGLHQVIDELPDAAIEKMLHYAAFLRYEEAQKEPMLNAETIAAMMELEEGCGEVVTIDQIMAELNADD